MNETNGSVSIFLTRSGANATTVTLDLDDGITGVGITGGAYVPVAVGAGKTTRGGSLVDVNGDGRRDVLTANLGDNTVVIHTNSASAGAIASGDFNPAATLTVAGLSAIRAVGASDIDGDGQVDVVAVDQNQRVVSVFRNISTNLTAALQFQAKIDFPVGISPEICSCGMSMAMERSM